MKTDDVPPLLAAAAPDRKISGFWRRPLALMFDAAVLGLFGLVAGLFLFDKFVTLGGWGRLIGFTVALAYYTILNSKLGKGKTVGKRMMGIEVIDSTGGHISVGRSCLRYLVLGISFFLNGAPLPTSVAMSPVGYFIGFLVLGVGGSIVYLYIFNRETRQSLHDLAVGTFVVKGKGCGQFVAKSIWRAHLAIVGGWCLLVIGFSFVVPSLSKRGVFPDLIVAQQKLQSSGKVNAATLFAGKTWSYLNGVKQQSSYLQVTADWRKRPHDYKVAAEEMASIILASYPNVREKDLVDVTIRYGYNIGIAQWSTSQNFRYSPQQWDLVLGQAK
jgi:uncharacterized RDD family membrane protein YckC